MRRAILVVAVMVALGGCGGSSETCIVTATANKVCGADAAAWCRVTDSIRSQYGDSSGIQPTCDQLETQYPAP